MARGAACAALIGAVSAGSAAAAEIFVSADIAVSTTWTADNTYNLLDQVYVLPGATLTIEAGTIVASTPSMTGSGSLAVTRGAQIFVQGTAAQPVIMTSTADVATWTGGDPTTGVWREAANEWGNLTIMGRAYISENAIVGNLATCDAGNEADMEGLVTGPAFDRYGGGDDDDDSGSISYLSLRYTGRVVGLGNELNGLSLGGIGRNTDIHHVEVMNNVDDGIEIWGGTVNLKYFTIWNVGDDSLDVDQGWRGKAQFGLIVQGYSVDAAQGSGVGDNALEIDGAEQSDYQPVTTATIYNLTVIGQPVGGDHGTAWRDNARVQLRNSIFMDLGERLVAFDNVDGDGGAGYGHNGTLSWADTWLTPYNMVPAHANDGACLPRATFYQAQTSGRLCEITDSVFFRNLNAAAYTEATARGVFDAANNNVLIPGFRAVDAPIRHITRGPAVVRGGLTMLPVIKLDPRAAKQAITSVGAAPADGFFTPAQYRGAFGSENWALGWTAADAFGFYETIGSQSFCDSSDGALTLCPCSNPGNPDTGCDIAQGTGGVKLTVTDQNKGGLAATLVGTGYPPAQTPTAIVLRANNVEATPVNFGDGLRCVGLVGFARLAATSASVGTSVHPIGHGAGPGTFNYQLWFRNTPASFCVTTGTSSGAFNLSNGRTLTW